MTSFFIPFVLCSTVVASVGIGILFAYAGVIGILHAFNHQPQSSYQRPRLVLVQSQASGD